MNKWCVNIMTHGWAVSVINTESFIFDNNPYDLSLSIRHAIIDLQRFHIYAFGVVDTDTTNEFVIICYAYLNSVDMNMKYDWLSFRPEIARYYFDYDPESPYQKIDINKFNANNQNILINDYMSICIIK